MSISHKQHIDKLIAVKF